MIPTHKERFLRNTTAAKWHADLIVKSEFLAALDAARLEYASRLARNNPHVEVGLLLRGAHEFIRNFLTLSDPAVTPKVHDYDNLT